MIKRYSGVLLIVKRRVTGETRLQVTGCRLQVAGAGCRYRLAKSLLAKGRLAISSQREAGRQVTFVLRSVTGDGGL
jgi:hypothetical protein